MILSNKQKEIILQTFGEERYNETIRCADLYANKWHLEKFETIDKPARNLVLTCISPKHGSCVLKIGIDNDFKSEIDVLRAFNSRGYCKLYEYSKEDKTFLIERIIPGDDLWHETTREERRNLFCDLYRDWYSAPLKSIYLSMFPTFMSLIENKNADVGKTDFEFSHPHIENAKTIIASLKSTYPDTLLHGDLAFSNILKNKNGGYTAIDPVGIVGSSVLNISKFVLNEFGNSLAFEPMDIIVNFINLISEKVNIPNEIIKNACMLKRFWGCVN